MSTLAHLESWVDWAHADVIEGNPDKAEAMLRRQLNLACGCEACTDALLCTRCGREPAEGIDDLCGGCREYVDERDETYRGGGR